MEKKWKKRLDSGPLSEDDCGQSSLLYRPSNSNRSRPKAACAGPSGFMSNAQFGISETLELRSGHPSKIKRSSAFCARKFVGTFVQTLQGGMTTSGVGREHVVRVGEVSAFGGRRCIM